MSDDSKPKDPKDFRELVLQGFWLDLKDHLERGAIIIVHPSLDLQTVADAVTADNAAKVGGWIAMGKLNKPTAEQITAWNEMQAKEFSFVIAQPYVLIQEAGH